MIGNDVVDLNDPETATQGLNPRFDQRVFSADELRRLFVAEDTEVLRWTLWAAKESAFKLAKRANPATVFAHALFETDLNDEGFGSVCNGRWKCAVAASKEGSAIHAIATPDHGDHKQVICGVEEILPGIDPSVGARKLATACVARHLGADPGNVTITKGSDRIPVLQIDNKSVGSLSLSHHGLFVAFAWSPVV